MVKRIVIFLFINFAAIAVGRSFTKIGVNSDWYSNLVIAPWTPPGWVFGIAWTIVMICFAIFMSHLWHRERNKKQILALFSLQWILNAMWNPAFFYFQNIVFGLVIIVALTLVVGSFLFYFRPNTKVKTVLILPYLIWLIFTTTMNAYIFIYN